MSQAKRRGESGHRSLTQKKTRLTELLELCDRNGVPVPLIIDSATSKAFRTRGAGNAQNKKEERRRSELDLVSQRVVQVEAALRERGVPLSSGEECDGESD